MMSLTWYLLGVLTALFAYLLFEYSKKNPLNWIGWLGLVSSITLILFSIAWGVGAVLEGVPRAGSMGLLVFGLSGIVIFTLTVRYIGKKQSKNSHEL